MAQKLHLTVDECGRSEFGDDCGRFGDALQVGSEHWVADYYDLETDFAYTGKLRITEIGTSIHTRSGSGANYVYVTAETLED